MAITIIFVLVFLYALLIKPLLNLFFNKKILQIFVVGLVKLYPGKIVLN